MYPTINKNLFYIGIILFFSACTSQKSVDNSFNLYSDAIAVNKISAPENEAKLIFFRAVQDRKDNSDGVVNVFVNDRYLSTLLAEGYSELNVCPGVNNFFATAREGNELSPDYAPKSIYLEAGKTYFIELNKFSEELYQSQVLSSHAEVLLSINGLKRQVHTISRYAEDCAAKLAKEAADEQEIQARKAAENSIVEQSLVAVVAVLPAPIVPKESEVVPAYEAQQSLASAIVLFPFAQFEFSTVDVESRHAVQAFANDYKRLKMTNKIRLRGHADPIGDEDLNILLSQKRIKAIRDALIAQGVRAGFEEDALGSRRVLVDCANGKNNDGLGDLVTHAQKVSGTYWVQIYAGVAASRNVNIADYKSISDKLKKSVVLKKSSDGLVRILLGDFSDFSTAKSAVKASGIQDAFIRFISKNSDTSTQLCNQPNRRVDIEVIE